MIGNGVGHETRPAASSPTEDPVQQSNGTPDEGYGPPHPLSGVFERIRELAEYANFYVEARKDMLRASVRSLVLKAAIGLVAVVAGVALIVMAAVYLMSGIAHGVGFLLGERYWLGELIVSASFFNSGRCGSSRDESSQ